MGREVRRVPPNWSHPETERSNGQTGKQPMFDKTYASARAEWLEGLRKWEAGEDPDREQFKNDDGSYQDYWEWTGNPPDRVYYRPWRDEEATWFQLWETVSEGTPITPPFTTREELAAYLAEKGDEWDQKRAGDPRAAALFGIKLGKPGWGRARAEAFVKAGWAPSFAISNGRALESKDIPLAATEDAAPTATTRPAR